MIYDYNKMKDALSEKEVKMLDDISVFKIIALKVNLFHKIFYWQIVKFFIEQILNF